MTPWPSNTHCFNLSTRQLVEDSAKRASKSKGESFKGTSLGFLWAVGGVSHFCRSVSLSQMESENRLGSNLGGSFLGSPGWFERETKRKTEARKPIETKGGSPERMSHPFAPSWFPWSLAQRRICKTLVTRPGRDMATCKTPNPFDLWLGMS